MAAAPAEWAPTPEAAQGTRRPTASLERNHDVRPDGRQLDDTFNMRRRESAGIGDLESLVRCQLANEPLEFIGRVVSRIDLDVAPEPDDVFNRGCI